MNYTNGEIWAELMKRLSNEALYLIIEWGDKPMTFNEFETLWNERYPNMSMFLKVKE